MTPSSDQDEQLPYLTESSEPEGIEKMRKCNLRKSLAWDSAFFTSAGVIFELELSTTFLEVHFILILLDLNRVSFQGSWMLRSCLASLKGLARMKRKLYQE